MPRADHATQAVGPPHELGRFTHCSPIQGVADTAARHGPAVLEQRRHDDQGQSSPRAKPAEHGDVALAIATEPEVASLDDGDGPEARANHLLEEVHCRELQEIDRRAQHQDAVSPILLDKLGTIGRSREDGHELFRAEQLERMRVERDDHRGPAHAAGFSPQLLQQGDMAPMHTVKVADGHGPAPAGGGGRIRPRKRRDHMHSFQGLSWEGGHAVERATPRRHALRFWQALS